MKTCAAAVAAVLVAAGQAGALQLQFYGHWMDVPEWQDWSQRASVFLPFTEEDDVEMTMTVDSYWLSHQYLSDEKTGMGSWYDMTITEFHARSAGPAGSIEWNWQRGRRSDPFYDHDTRLVLHDVWAERVEYYTPEGSTRRMLRSLETGAGIGWEDSVMTNYIDGTYTADVFDATGNLVNSTSALSHAKYFMTGLGEEDGVRWLNDQRLTDIPTNKRADGYISLPFMHLKFMASVDDFRIIHDDLVAGDADADRDFDQLDLVQVSQAGKYLTGQLAPWSQGDWNADGVFDQLDLVAAQSQSMYQAGPQAAVRAVPEPCSAWTLIYGLLMCLVLGRLSYGIGYAAGCQTVPRR